MDSTLSLQIPDTYGMMAIDCSQKTGLRDEEAMNRRAFILGMLSSLAGAAIMVISRIVAHSPTLPEVLTDVATRVVPLRLFSIAVEALGPWTKRSLVIVFVALLVAIGGLIGIAWRKFLARGTRPRQLAAAGLLGLTLWLFAMLVVLPASLQGFFGIETRPWPGSMVISWAASALAYSLVLMLLTGKTETTGDKATLAEPDAKTGRRSFVKTLGWTIAGIVVAAGLGAGIWKVISRLSSRVISSLGGAPMTPDVTPNDEFYTVSKNFEDPTVDAATWKLEITGLVERPITITHQQLLDMPATDQFQTLECISNPVGGDLISTASWQGVQLRYLLDQAGPKTEAIKAVIRAADGYSDSIALTKALDSGTLLAFRMNGVPLPNVHGFPARLLVPDIYGMKNVKWVTGIELVDYDYKGYWQERGWSDSAQIETMSRLDVPGEDGEYVLPQEAALGGIAFAGSRGISRVELSTDGGKTWNRAELKQPLSQFTWVIWAYNWSPPREGEYELLVRAADGTGSVQTAEVSYPLPGGATGYHEVIVKLVQTK